MDPFFADDGDERTGFPIPQPGHRHPRSTLHRAAPADAPAANDMPLPDIGLNPLVAAAHPLLALVPQIRATAHLADPMALKESLAHGLREFEAAARTRGIVAERALVARYILCTVLDEAAGSTPWGGSGQWSQHNLLVAFHDENAGGDRVFELLATLAEDPAPNRDLLELIYAALCLGFEGRYGAEGGGRLQLDAAREHLAGIVRRVRGEHAPELAQHWRGQVHKRRAWLSWLPLWVSAACAALLLLGVYLALSFSLEARSDPVMERIQALNAPALTRPAAAPTPAAPAAPRLATLLGDDIQAGTLAVRDEADRSTVTLRGDGMFAPGSATLRPEHETSLRHIASAAAQVGGDVLVTGHTDNQPIRTLRFPSNFALSLARAEAVRTLLVAGGLPAEQVRAEGRAAGEPLAANDSAEHRALNRRIEVLVVPRQPAERARP